MKTRLTFLFTALLAAGVLIGTHADNAAVQKELAALYAKSDQAMKKKDVKVLMTLTAPDFTMKGPKGQSFNRDQIMQIMQMQLARLKTVDSATSKVEKLTVKGSEATAIVRQKLAATMDDPQGKTHKIVQESTSKDLWVKTSKGWKVKTTEGQSQKVWIDGKLFNPMGGRPK